jgi:hypothetical protein
MVFPITFLFIYACNYLRGMIEDQDMSVDVCSK